MTSVVPKIYAGQELLVTLTLRNQAGALADPTNLIVTYEDAGLVSGPTVVNITGLTHIGTGIYTLLIDTTNFVADIWNLQAQATGAVLSVDVEQFQILARPLG